jgi:hypothetical protein
MTLKVVFRDERNNIKTVECENIKEGEQGLHLIESAPNRTVGYIPYDNLERVTPSEATESG